MKYNIYSNNGSGGPVDYSNAVASTDGVSFGLGPLMAPGDYAFAVRACDTTTGLEEANTDACVRVSIDASGADVSGIPGPPHALWLASSAGGGCRVTWAYRPSPDRGVPGEFLVSLSPATTGAVIPTTAVVPFVPGQAGYSYVFPGPFRRGPYTASVRSSNTSGLDASASTVTAVAGQAPLPLLMDPVSVRQVASNQMVKG